MELESIVSFLRSSCLIDDPELVSDSSYIALTDVELTDILRIVCSRVHKHTNVESMSESKLYPVILLAKKELYHRLAVSSANEYTLGGEAGTLNRSDRFSHFYKLIEAVQKEYEQWVEEETLNTDVSNTTNYGNGYSNGEIFLSSRYYSMRNYNHASKPVVELSIDNLYENSVEISWSIKKLNRFRCIKVFIHDNFIVDKYDKNRVNKEAKLLLNSRDIQNNTLRIANLDSEKLYFLAIILEEQNGLIGYDEVQFVTLGTIEDSEDSSTEDVEENND